MSKDMNKEKETKTTMITDNNAATVAYFKYGSYLYCDSVTKYMLEGKAEQQAQLTEVRKNLVLMKFVVNNFVRVTGQRQKL